MSLGASQYLVCEFIGLRPLVILDAPGDVKACHGGGPDCNAHSPATVRAVEARIMRIPQLIPQMIPQMRVSGSWLEISQCRLEQRASC